MGRTLAAITGMGLMLGACATPGIDYEARIMPKAPEAAELRNISVERFGGPSGGWFASRLENVLASAQFDGAYLFNVDGTGYPIAAPAGVYSGFVEIMDVEEHHSEHVEHKCVERDKDDKCIREKEYIEYCVSTTLDVSAFVELTDIDTGEVVFAASYPGTANDYSCEDYIGYYDDYGLADAILSFTGSVLGFNDIGLGYGGPGALVREALSDTLGPIRRDVAPRNANVRAKFATKAVDPIVKADPRFQQAISLAKNSPAASCDLWSTLGATYPDAPSVQHNLGACAEASGDYAAAQRLYAQASEIAGRTPGAADMFKRLNASLTQISQRRSDLISLEDLTGEPASAEPDS